MRKKFADFGADYELYADYFQPAAAARFCGISLEAFEREVWTKVRFAIIGEVVLFARKDLTAFLIAAKGQKAILKSRTPPWADREAIRAVYAECRRLTKKTGVQHHVDHIDPICGTIVSGLHVHTNLRVVTASENLKKGNRAFSTCGAARSRF